jgi:cellulose synthase/poly-beta-1,6-N-acetylglucosamine synthase-like glycosyltransferase
MEVATPLTFVVPCKGRLFQVKQTLPHMIAELGLEDRILVVDYSCPDHVADWVASLRHPQVDATWVEGEVFNLAHARNVGVRRAQTPLICSIDADNVLQPGFRNAVVSLLLDENVVLVGNLWRKDDFESGCGAHTYRKSDWTRIRGFDESLTGWGYEEDDFFKRMAMIGKIANYDRSLNKLMPHPDDFRVQFYEEKNKMISARSNKNATLVQGRQVNPKGFGETKIHRKDTALL